MAPALEWAMWVQGGHICTRAVFYFSAQVRVTAQFTPAAWASQLLGVRSPHVVQSHGSCTVSLPGGDGEKVVLECLKIPSPSLITLGLFGDRGGRRHINAKLSTAGRYEGYRGYSSL